MLKYLSGFLFIFFILSTISYAKIEDAALKKEYGPDLTKAPFFLRFDFQKKYNVPWDKSFYSERKAFLTKYDADLVAEKAQERADAKAAADKEKERLRQKKEEQIKEQNRLRAEQEEDKEEQQDYNDRQKQMQDAMKQQQQDLQQMTQSLKQTN